MPDWFFNEDLILVTLVAVSMTLATWFLAARDRQDRAVLILGATLAAMAIAVVAARLLFPPSEGSTDPHPWARILVVFSAAAGAPAALGAFLVARPAQSRRRRLALLVGALVAVVVSAPAFLVVGALCALVFFGDPWPG
jgi:cyanate permease